MSKCPQTLYCPPSASPRPQIPPAQGWALAVWSAVFSSCFFSHQKATPHPVPRFSQSSFLWVSSPSGSTFCSFPPRALESLKVIFFSCCYSVKDFWQCRKWFFLFKAVDFLPFYRFSKPRLSSYSQFQEYLMNPSSLWQGTTELAAPKEFGAGFPPGFISCRWD